MVASVATVASAAPVPSALNTAMPCLTAPTSSDSPRIPFVVIITAAKTVSRASEKDSGPPESIRVRISADLDDGDCDREHQRAVGFTDPVGDHLGVVDAGQHRGGQDQPDEDHRERSRTRGRRLLPGWRSPGPGCTVVQVRYQGRMRAVMGSWFQTIGSRQPAAGSPVSRQRHRSVTRTPSWVSSRRVSGSEIPITEDGSPSTPSMNQPPRPSMVHAPATWSGSPLAR